MVSDFTVVGKGVPRIDSRLLVTGAAEFTGDITLPGMLYGRILRSKYAHAKILRIDTSRAKRLTGVRCVITGKDVPQVPYGASHVETNIPPDERVLPLDKVRYAGDPIVAVAAVDPETAEEALELIDVEFEELPSVLSAEEALRPGAPLVHEWAKGNLYSHEVILNTGNVEKGFSESDHIREDTFVTHVMNHAFLEARVCLAYFDQGGKLTLWISSQAPFGVRHVVAAVMGLAENRVRVIHPFVGGGFGGKVDADHIELIAACLSKESGRPVRIEHSRAEQFLAARHRHEMVIKLKSGVKKDGTLVARSFDCLYDGGAYICTGLHVVVNAAGFSDLIWRVPNLHFRGRRIYTNKPPCGAMRGFGNPQMRFADNQHMDQIAHDLGIDTVDFFLKNVRQKGDVTNARYVLNSCGLKECLEKSSESAHWREKRGKLPPWRGIGVGLGCHTAGYRGGVSDGSGSIVKIYEDGSVTLFAGTEDHGQGSRTIFAQMVSEVLGIPLERVNVATLDTETCPPCVGCYGSRGTLQGGRATIAAAEDARRQVFEIVQELWEVSGQDLCVKGGMICVQGVPSKVITYEEALKVGKVSGKVVPIIGKAFFEPDTECIDIFTGTGNVSAGYGFGAQIAEVEVDPDTGKVKVLSVVAANDVGSVLNPLSLNGQSEGSVHMGISHTFYEQVCFDKDGRIINPSFLGYKIGTSLDTPQIKNIWVESNEPAGPMGAKGIGETTMIPTPAALANAIYDAIGVRIHELPITPEKILKALEEKRAIHMGEGFPEPTP
jgi:4-hydroxybenzoyl-CoA reductase alpha subunit